MTMILQYYERLNLIDLIPSDFEFNASVGDSYENYLKKVGNGQSLVKTQLLHNYLFSLGGHGSLGETLYSTIPSIMKKYFENFFPEEERNKLIFKSYNFWSYMKENIDKGFPCIGNTGLSGTGYYSPSVTSSEYQSMGVERHQMVVYGYTLNALGGLDEFVCHTGWHERNTYNVYSMVYTSGWSFIGNVQITENF